MKSYKILSVDESGKASYSHPSPLFIVSGIIMPENLKKKIDSQIRKLKLIFHSRDMSRKKAQFVVFNDEKMDILNNICKISQVDKVKFRLINRKFVKNKFTSRFETTL